MQSKAKVSKTIAITMECYDTIKAVSDVAQLSFSDALERLVVQKSVKQELVRELNILQAKAVGLGLELEYTLNEKREGWHL